MCRFCPKSGLHKEENCICNPASRNYGKSLSQLNTTARLRTLRRIPPTGRTAYTPRPMPTTGNAWNSWAVGEETRINSFKTKESYKKQKMEMEERKKDHEEPEEYTIRETFKRTGGRTVDGKLGSKPIYEEVTVSKTTYKSGGEVVSKQVESKAASAKAPEGNAAVKVEPVADEKREKNVVVPPHLRPRKTKLVAQMV